MKRTTDDLLFEMDRLLEDQHFDEVYWRTVDARTGLLGWRSTHYVRPMIEDHDGGSDEDSDTIDDWSPADAWMALNAPPDGCWGPGIWSTFDACNIHIGNDDPLGLCGRCRALLMKEPDDDASDGEVPAAACSEDAGGGGGAGLVPLTVGGGVVEG